MIKFYSDKAVDNFLIEIQSMVQNGLKSQQHDDGLSLASLFYVGPWHLGSWAFWALGRFGLLGVLCVWAFWLFGTRKVVFDLLLLPICLPTKCLWFLTKPGFLSRCHILDDLKTISSRSFLRFWKE